MPIHRPRTREFAPLKSGSRRKPERINLRCTTEQCGRFLSNIEVGKMIMRARCPNDQINISEVTHRVIIPVFEKVIRAYRFGSSAEKAAARVYLAEFVPKEDYIRNRHERYQERFSFGK